MKIYDQNPIPLSDGMQRPDYGVVFIGGFGDKWLGIMHGLWRRFDGFDVPGSWVSGYYHWDGDGWGLAGDRCDRIAFDLERLLDRFPETHLVLIGHSYGGSASMQVARLLQHDACRLDVLTIDAVSRRQTSDRAQGVGLWINTYLSRGGGWLDIVPRIGGRWGECEEADVNLAYDGTICVPGRGLLYSHRDPASMMDESPVGDASPVEMLAARVMSGTRQVNEED
ncbi:alpha/beta hydrolase [Akkermansia sp. N21116]|uniref:alpha/beta fold hydrolase n=2 Tax=unclassified Akkermansia TaxID=2608915 RepID=UPI00244ED7B9|nr:alpha/beta hydrolase [Akkermansia sp. N21116]WPX40643.1 alpha/beta hydrolase [Akkermansia sp. N21116]